MVDFVVMVERSAGNAEVGEMWTETAVFTETATLADVKDWIDGRVHRSGYSGPNPNLGQGRVTLQIAQHPTEAPAEAD